jgi:uncharacterized Fe-S radical SAM superfamily protein PflX
MIFITFGEEDVLAGKYGSGTIFLAGCNLQCVFCQNWDISQFREGETISDQYYPAFRAKDFPPLNRRLQSQEYESAVEVVFSAGLYHFADFLHSV